MNTRPLPEPSTPEVTTLTRSGHIVREGKGPSTGYNAAA